MNADGTATKIPQMSGWLPEGCKLVCKPCKGPRCPKGRCKIVCSPGGDPGEKCGQNTCAPREFCCNESCGICAPKGGFCTQQACEPTAASECRTHEDCRLYSNYCNGCACDALGAGDENPKCPTSELVQCFADPCMDQRAVCVDGGCTTVIE